MHVVECGHGQNKPRVNLTTRYIGVPIRVMHAGSVHYATSRRYVVDTRLLICAGNIVSPEATLPHVELQSILIDSLCWYPVCDRIPNPSCPARKSTITKCQSNDHNI